MYLIRLFPAFYSGRKVPPRGERNQRVVQSHTLTAYGTVYELTVRLGHGHLPPGENLFCMVLIAFWAGCVVVVFSEYLPCYNVLGSELCHSDRLLPSVAVAVRT